LADGAIYGILGPSQAFFEQNRNARVIGAGELAVHHGLDLLPRLERAQAALKLEQFRRAGGTALLFSHDEELLERLCDELWWVSGTRIQERGAPPAVLAAYRAHVAEELRHAGNGISVPVSPSMRRGDGRAAIRSVELLSETGQPTAVWRSGEAATVRVFVQFAQPVADPVIGILIRTRIGLNVYGTNTELENLRFGPVPAHQAVKIAFSFPCNLCPGEYTLTVASHDPDGAWHDWLEDAVAFSITDSRYTAGVANLRADVRLLADARLLDT